MVFYVKQNLKNFSPRPKNSFGQFLQKQPGGDRPFLGLTICSFPECGMSVLAIDGKY
jgi:hypothetical protein